jgi:D-glycero-D-manno-heptose 1,7-bisphosphate phosphatase
MVKAIFFDRDGVLNDLVQRSSSSFTAPWRIEEFNIIESSIQAVKNASAMGFATFVVSNQPDLHDNLMTWRDEQAMLECIKLHFSFTEILYAYIRTGIDYKPKTGMVDYLCAKYNVDRTQSYMIGDRWKDVVCGKRSQLTTLIVKTDGYGVVPDKYTPGKYVPDYWVESAYEAVELIKQLESEKQNGNQDLR